MMQCYVYKSRKHPDMYLYLRSQNDFGQIPEALLERFGKPEFVLEFDLAKRQALGREDIAIVKHNLETTGYHLQLPEKISTPEPISSRH